MAPQKLRIAFMGTPDFAVVALDAIAQTDHELVAVYTQPPKPAGRGKKLRASQTHEKANQLGIPVYHPKTLKTPEAQAEFKALHLDVAIVAAYGLILPKAILDAPRFGCLNIHGSLLPRWRGAAPIQRAILAGDDETGICIMQMDEGLDTGAVLLKEATAITASTTAQSLHDTLAGIGGRLCVDAINHLANNTLPPAVVQTEKGMTYAKMLNRADGKINWQNSALEIERQLRALTPWPGTWFEIAGERLKLHKVTLCDQSGTPGTILDKNMTIACGSGAVTLTSLQPANKKPMDGRSFLNGSSLSVGDNVT